MAKEKILVVDDSATQLIMYKMALTKAGYLVISAKNGVEGMHMVDTENPDLIVSDIIMPELNGYQFCRLVKDDPSRSHVPIILLTSLGQQQDRFWGIEAGSDSFVTKTADTAELLTEVERLLRTVKKPVDIDYRAEETPRVTSPEEAEESIKAKLNRILERLLYESTVSNRMRDIARHAYDRQEVIARLFDLFRQIIEYNSSVLVLFRQDSADITVDLQSETGRPIIDRSLELMFEQDQVPQKFKLGQIKNRRETIHGKEKLKPGAAWDIQSNLIVPLEDDRHLIGILGVFSPETFAYNKDTYKLVQLIAREFVVTIKYIWKLEEIENMKRSFTSTVVNDLRGPILANQSFVEALYFEHVDPVTPDQKDILASIMANNKKLLSFTNDIVDIAKIEEGILEVFPEDQQARAVIDEAIRNMTITAKQKEIELVNGMDDVELHGVFDFEKIVQVLNNLVSNGIKFSPEGSAVEIGAEPFKQDGQWIRFMVKDSGVGIPDEEKPLIFEKYKHGGVFSSDEHAGGGGVGLGLAVCKSIVEAHHGKIWVDSSIGEGATFFFTVAAKES